MRALSLLALILLLTSGCNPEDPPKKVTPSLPRQLSAAEVADLPVELQALIPLHQAKKPAVSGEWLYNHEQWPQNLEQYKLAGPIQATAERRTIYIQPLGEFTKEQRRIVELSAEYLQAFFQLPVKMSDDLELSLVPADARRQEGSYGEQLLAPYILGSILKPRLPEDAVVSIAFTPSDLWQGGDGNYCFGQATDRVGVWSFCRFGDPSHSDDAFRLALRRTLHVAGHETGHMFSLPHCLYFECQMNGANNLTEMDSQPLWVCPCCQAKISYATGCDVRKQLAELAAFGERNGLKEEATFWEKSLQAVDGN